MKTLYARAKLLIPAAGAGISNIRSACILRRSHSARCALALLLALLIATGPFTPLRAQTPSQNPPSNPTPQTPAAQKGSPAGQLTSLGLATHDFTRGPRAFPQIWKPYFPVQIKPPALTNSPRLDQLIHDGTLELTLQDAVELALENSMDIVVQRYNPWIADTGILRAQAGGTAGSTPGALFSSSTTNTSPLSFDPNLTSTVSIDSRTTPVNNPFISGTGGATLTDLFSHSTQFNTQYTQGFHTGTNFFATGNNTRSSSTSKANFFNPVVQSSLSLGFSQPLLRGFGIEYNTRNIRIARNNRKIADWAFAQQAITTVTNTIIAYWELVYARANVKVDEQAVTVSEKLYNDNKKQFEAGTMAPLDVTRAQSEVATDRQNLAVSRAVQLQDEQILKNAISKDPHAANLVNVEIITTDQPTAPAVIENPSFEDSLNEAYSKRPELQQQALNLKNADIDIRATRNALLPSLNLTAQYTSVGLAGNSPIAGARTLVSNGVPIVDSTGQPVTVDVGGVPTPLFESATVSAITGTNQQGFGNAQGQIFHNRFPEYTASLTLGLPLRNRAAQADSVSAILAQRQQQASLQQLKNAILLDVRNTYIALTQDRAQVEAAQQARELQQQTFDAEQKKYRLGASTVYNVILTQRDLISAQGTELRALANLEEAKASYERALGRTLDVNHVTIADARTGETNRDTLIPGTLHGKVLGAEESFDRGSSR